MKKALITGVTGQDGSYLADFLLGKGYEVFGLERRLSTSGSHFSNIQHLLGKSDVFKLISGDLTDQGSLMNAVRIAEPDEVYNLGSQSFVAASWKQPELTGNVTGLGVIRMLEAVRLINPEIKFYQASSSEMFGKVKESPQNENTPFHPRSPYGVAKLYGHWATINYRESYGMFAASGILFNHESPRRGLEFVTRKIVNGAVKISLGLAKKLTLGNIEAKRDWGFAGDYVEAMWLMLQRSEPEDFVIATGKNYSVKEFVELTFISLGLDWRKYVEYDAPSDLRPAEIDQLVGDASKAENKLGWRPRVRFNELLKMMVESEIILLAGDRVKT